ncbi:hypothetical protein SK069_16160 [Patulibacter brassicae]|uniref:Uncharacterized protein n=1 Tax=Patulibacter brassicae TaxID=1705717 RepID=A0ABU4VMR0_9ACTN|nr:hypothetical protein [Patulibacter brassicae]MDX8153132.1 hypothetical protein [Patulibacter brassicae]
MRSAGDRGQATIEHAALVALVAGLLVLVGSLAAWGPSLVNAVHSGIRRALCVAGGDDCAAFHRPQPCLLASDDRAHRVGGTVLAVRIQRDRSLLIERRSDGTYAVTDTKAGELGGRVKLGRRSGSGERARGDEGVVRDARRSGGADGRGASRVGALKRLVDPQAQAGADLSATIRGARGARWELPDRAAMQRFLDAHGQTRSGPIAERLRARLRLGRPDVERYEVGVEGGLHASASASAAGEEATIGGSVLRGMSGTVAYDRRTGRASVGLRLGATLVADLAAPLKLQYHGRYHASGEATLIVDRGGRPRELRLTGRLDTEDGARQREVETRLDVTRPALRDAVGRMLGGVRGLAPGRIRAGARELGRWMVDDGWAEEREYRTATLTDGTDEELGLGIGLGYTNQDVRTMRRLASVRTRPPGGVWESRPDCLAPPRG